MALPTNWDGQGLSPSITISDLDDTEQFTFIAKTVNPAGIRDFNLNSLGIHAGVNEDVGTCTLLIDDSDNILTDSDSRKSCAIKNQWKLDINLGKGVTGDKWFSGFVNHADVIRADTGQQFIKLDAFGYGIRLLERVSKIERIQDRLNSDGVSFDDTDTSMNVSELVKDIFQDKDHYIYRSLDTESALTLNIQDNTLQLTEFKDYYQSWAFLMSRLAAVGGAVWGVNPSKQVFFRQPSTVSSGLLLSGDETNAITTNWNKPKLCYVTGPIEWTDSTGDSGYSVLHSPGATQDSLDVNVDPTINADFNLSTNWLAIEWTTGQATLSKIAAKFKKVGTPADGDAFFQIVGESTGGGPNMNDVRKRVRIPLQILTSFSTSNPSVMKEYSFEKITVTPDEKLFAVFEKYGDGSNHFVLQYDSGGSLTYWTSSNGSSWASSTGDFAFRTYPTRRINITLYNTATARRFGVREKVVNTSNIQDLNSINTMLIGLSDILGKEKRLYKPIITSVPDNYIEPGQSIRILDTFGLDTTPILLGFDISMSASNPSEKLGATEITWSVGEFF